MGTRRRILAALTLGGAAGYVFLALAGPRGAGHIAAHLLLSALMAAGYGLCRALGAAGRPWILAGAVAFRLAALAGEPVLSDDLYRYVWDGRVQAAGIHPYRYAPLDEALVPLRDDNIWPRINHPSLPTIYPPGAQAAFALLALAGLGTWGFRAVFAVLDLGVVWLLDRALRRRGLPHAPLVLYAWNPLAVVEVVGSGHLEPLGVLPLVAAALAVESGRRALAGAALGAATGAKLVPGALVASLVRRGGVRAVAGWTGIVALVFAPYALWGRTAGGGLWAYAVHWERNGFFYGLLRALLEACDSGVRLGQGVAALNRAAPWLPVPWDALYEAAWPPRLARLVTAALAASWLLWLAWRGPRDVWREWRLGLGGVLLLAPTVHPWYWLWVLPFAARDAAVFWLLLAGLAPLAYVTPGEVPVLVRAVEYGVPLLWLGWRGTRGRPLGV